MENLLRGLLARAFFERHGKAPSQQALADALLVIEGYAADADEDRLYQRVAEHGGALWLDLGDTEGRAVEITGNGWKITDPPVKFKRTTLNSPLPEPVRGGELAELWEWLNVAEADRPLVLAWLVAVLFCDIPHPVLGLFGEQGTGKSTAEKLLVSLVDPRRYRCDSRPVIRIRGSPLRPARGWSGSTTYRACPIGSRTRSVEQSPATAT
ncbi:hypothetical protein GCM10029992_12210 [Glycomyces albus]